MRGSGLGLDVKQNITLHSRLHGVFTFGAVSVSLSVFRMYRIVYMETSFECGTG